MTRSGTETYINALVRFRVTFSQLESDHHNQLPSPMFGVDVDDDDAEDAALVEALDVGALVARAFLEFSRAIELLWLPPLAAAGLALLVEAGTVKELLLVCCPS